MTVLKPNPVLNTNQFIYRKETETFTACASDLGWPVGQAPLGQVYDDACDVGFTFVSERTGNRLTMVLAEEVKDPNYSGGWRCLKFVPADIKLLGNMFNAVVFND